MRRRLESSRVVLDDELLADGGLVELFTRRSALEGRAERGAVNVDPARSFAGLRGVERCGDERDLAAGLVHLDLVVGAHAVARNVDALAVDQDVVVANELTRL